MAKKKGSRSEKPTTLYRQPTGDREDNPSRRFSELSEDREFSSEEFVNTARARHDAMACSRTMAPVVETALTPATPGLNNWVELGPTGIPNGQTYGSSRVIVTGRVTEIVQHPTNSLILYVAAARGGIWKSIDGGVTWAPKSDHEESLAIGALAISKSNPQTLYAGTGEGDIYFYRLKHPLSSVNAAYEGLGILKSTDGGETWTLQGSADFTGACFYHISIDPTNGSIAFAASNQGLYRTNNGGIDWALQEGGLPKITSSIIACSDVIVHPADPDIAYCAFWGKGIYKTTNATKVKPTWTKLAGGLPSTNIRRIALAISPTSPKNVYALVASSSDGLRGFYTSDNDGKDWKSVGAATGIVSVFGAFTLNISVDISSPDVVYLSGVELYKAVRTFGKWSVTNIGNDIHPDNHALAGHPTDHLTIYAGNDGGIYKSTDGGKTWDDSINEGINITQFEFINQHPTSDAMVIGGTQDNGTEMYRNHPAFYHSADGDGGAAGVDASDPKNVIHTFYSASPRRSTEGGKFGSYSPISHGLVGNSLFYPPFTYDHSNSENLAFGTDLINLDDLQGLGGWKTTVALPGSQGRVSAVHYPNSKLIYAGTSSGNVYRLVKSGTSWTAEAIHDAPLPSRWIWDVSTLPGDTDTVIVVMAGYGTSHVWRGTNSGTSVYAWTDISGKAPKNVPDVPANLNYS